MLGRMIEIAAIAHTGQKDKAGEPYILHCLAVMNFLKSDDIELRCIAVGHDLFEDTDVTRYHLEALGFSRRVLDGIDALTKKEGQTYEEYQKAVLSNEDAMRVKLCDLRHNSDITRLKGISEKDFQRMARYHAFYLKIKEQLGE